VVSFFMSNVRVVAPPSEGEPCNQGEESNLERQPDSERDGGCSPTACSASSLFGEDSDPRGDCLGDLERPASPESMVPIDQLEPTIPVTESGDEAGKLSRCLDQFAGYPTTLAAAANIPPDISARRTEEMHRYFHDEFDAAGNEPHSILIKSALLPGDLCPFCERHIKEHPGPIIDVDRVINHGERPTLSGDQSTEPLVEDLCGHAGEHATRSRDVTAGVDSSHFLQNDQEEARRK